MFPFEEAATKEKFAERIKEYGTHFWLMCEEEKVIAFVDGMVTDEKNLTDEMYEKACFMMKRERADDFRSKYIAEISKTGLCGKAASLRNQ